MGLSADDGDIGTIAAFTFMQRGLDTLRRPYEILHGYIVTPSIVTLQEITGYSQDHINEILKTVESEKEGDAELLEIDGNRIFPYFLVDMYAADGNDPAFIEGGAAQVGTLGFFKAFHPRPILTYVGLDYHEGQGCLLDKVQEYLEQKGEEVKASGILRVIVDSGAVYCETIVTEDSTHDEPFSPIDEPPFSP